MYTPAPGSLAYRVIKWFEINPEEELTRTDVAQKFEIPTQNVDGSLASAIAAEALEKAKDKELGLVVYKAGPKLLECLTPRAIVTRGAKTRRDRLPTLDVSKLKVRHDMPPPDNTIQRKGANKYEQLFSRLDKPNASIDGIDARYRAALGKAAGKYTKDHGNPTDGPCFTVRTTSATTVGVWRTK